MAIKNTWLTLTPLLLILISSASISLPLPINPFYIGLQVGPAYLTNTALSTQIEHIDWSDITSSGYNFNGLIGVSLIDSVSLNMQAAYLHLNTNDADLPNSDAASCTVVTINGQYTYSKFKRIQPYLALGVGQYLPQGVLSDTNAGSAETAFQVNFGFAISIVPRITVTADYHYLGISTGDNTTYNTPNFSLYDIGIRHAL